VKRRELPAVDHSNATSGLLATQKKPCSHALFLKLMQQKM
jgi:hypothetical protein